MSNEKMKQWITHQDGLDKLQIEEVPKPKPGKSEVLVEIHAVSLNYRDTEVCAGDYGRHREISGSGTAVLPPCSDASGKIVEVGPDSSWKVGQRVISTFIQDHLSGQVALKEMGSSLGLPKPGVLCEYRVFPDHGLVACPDYLSDEEACTLPIAALTAWMGINWMHPIGSPQKGSDTSVLLQGTGGVSIAGLQIVKASGMKAIVTSSSDEKLEKARKLGADELINYKTTPDWHKKIMELTKDNGVDIILECGGASTLQKSFDCVSYGGLISCIGYVSGKEDAPGDRVNTNLLALRRNVTLKGILVGPRDRFEEMLELYKEKQIHPAVDKVFKFSEGKDAFQYMASGSHFGKVVIKVN